MSHAFSALAAKVLQNDLVSRSPAETRIGVVNSVGGMQEEEEFASEEVAPEGAAWISWLAHGSVLHESVELVDVSELSVIDRVLVHGDVVAWGSDVYDQMGIVQQSYTLLDLKFPSLAAKKRWDTIADSSPWKPHASIVDNRLMLERVPAEACAPMTMVQDGMVVRRGLWMGYILSVTLDVTVRFPDGAIARVPRATADDITPVRESDRMREAPNPGMKVRGSALVWSNAIWEKGGYRNRMGTCTQRETATIVRVDPCEIEVQWMPMAHDGTPPPPAQCRPVDVEVVSPPNTMNWSLSNAALIDLRSADNVHWPNGPGTLAASVKAPTWPPLLRLYTARDARSIAARVVLTRTLVDVRWQNGTVSQRVPTSSLVPVSEVGTHEFLPQDVVSFLPTSAAPPPPVPGAGDTSAPPAAAPIAPASGPAAPRGEGPAPSSRSTGADATGADAPRVGVVSYVRPDERTCVVEWSPFSEEDRQVMASAKNMLWTATSTSPEWATALRVASSHIASHGPPGAADSSASPHGSELGGAAAAARSLLQALSIPDTDAGSPAHTPQPSAEGGDPGGIDGAPPAEPDAEHSGMDADAVSAVAMQEPTLGEAFAASAFHCVFGDAAVALQEDEEEEERQRQQQQQQCAAPPPQATSEEPVDTSGVELDIGAGADTQQPPAGGGESGEQGATLEERLRTAVRDARRGAACHLRMRRLVDRFLPRRVDSSPAGAAPVGSVPVPAPASSGASQSEPASGKGPVAPAPASTGGAAGGSSGSGGGSGGGGTGKVEEVSVYEVAGASDRLALRVGDVVVFPLRVAGVALWRRLVAAFSALAKAITPDHAQRVCTDLLSAESASGEHSTPLDLLIRHRVAEWAHQLQAARERVSEAAREAAVDARISDLEDAEAARMAAQLAPLAGSATSLDGQVMTVADAAGVEHPALRLEVVSATSAIATFMDLHEWRDGMEEEEEEDEEEDEEEEEGGDFMEMEMLADGQYTTISSDANMSDSDGSDNDGGQRWRPTWFTEPPSFGTMANGGGDHSRSPGGTLLRQQHGGRLRYPHPEDFSVSLPTANESDSGGSSSAADEADDDDDDESGASESGAQAAEGDEEEEEEGEGEDDDAPLEPEYGDASSAARPSVVATAPPVNATGAVAQPASSPQPEASPRPEGAATPARAAHRGPVPTFGPSAKFAAGRGDGDAAVSASAALCGVPSFQLLPRPPSDHSFLTPAQRQAIVEGGGARAIGSSRVSAKRVQREGRLLRRNLPAGIHAFGYEQRPDLLRAVIVGPEDTPYSDVLFEFDIQLPDDYPASPPLVHYVSRHRERLHPNLYENGKVCLSLLGTWDGDAAEAWNPSRSTLLQLLVSIHGLVLVREPYFCEPGFEKMRGAPRGWINSKLYNETARLYALQAAQACASAPLDHSRDLTIQFYAARAPVLLAHARLLAEADAAAVVDDPTRLPAAERQAGDAAQAEGGEGQFSEEEVRARRPTLGFRRALRGTLPAMEAAFQSLQQARTAAASASGAADGGDS